MMLAFSEQEGVCGSGGGPAGRERALMLAVLEDAVRCLAGELGPSGERPTLAAEARAWFMTSDPRWPFSFVNICDALELDADRVRRQLFRDAPEFPPVAGDAQPVVAPRVRRENPPEDDVARMIRDGCPLREVAETFGISVSKASILSGGLASRIKAERDEEIHRLRDAGWTYRALAGHFHLSRIRVMRICARREGLSSGGPVQCSSAEAGGSTRMLAR
ncbi:MAG TPA: hypothetical protein VE911_01815 [Candidatus Nitrosopolaris sp.]|nr:hypothetical protein [Candidatus Nitrosopolaris sp.]